MRWIGPADEGSVLEILETHAAIDREAADQALLILTFDDATSGKELDARPSLPLFIRY